MFRFSFFEFRWPNESWANGKKHPILLHWQIIWWHQIFVSMVHIIIVKNIVCEWESMSHPQIRNYSSNTDNRKIYIEHSQLMSFVLYVVKGMCVIKKVFCCIAKHVKSHHIIKWFPLWWFTIRMQYFLFCCSLKLFFLFHFCYWQILWLLRTMETTQSLWLKAHIFIWINWKCMKRKSFFDSDNNWILSFACTHDVRTHAHMKCMG